MLTGLGFFILIYCKERQRRGILRSNSHDDLHTARSQNVFSVLTPLGEARLAL